ncbi:MAG: hypothetical protein K2X06_18085 [Burkholderiales bacterium]|nr:hypothetical protein [Burkholderiales bacterium]
MKTLKTSALLLAVLSPAAMASGMGVEDSLLRPSELKMLQRIAAVDPAFQYGDRVKRYFRIHPTTKNRIPLRVEMVLPESNGLFFGEYIRYVITISEPSGTITYEYDAGTAKRGRGTILVTPKDVVKTEYACGTSSCATRVERNGHPLTDRNAR